MIIASLDHMLHDALLEIARTGAPVAQQEPQIRRVLAAHGVPADIALADLADTPTVLEILLEAGRETGTRA